MKPREVITLCGSARFLPQFRSEHLRLSLEGHIVLTISGVSKTAADEEAWLHGALDALHRARIDMSQRIHVVNPGGYIGAHTRAEIDYAAQRGLGITYMESPTEGGADDGTTDQGCPGGETAAEDDRAGADSREVGAVVSEALPASEEGGAGEPSAGAPPQLTDLDPREEDIPEYVDEGGNAVMVLYDLHADRLEIRLEDAHMPRPEVTIAWYGTATAAPLRSTACGWSRHRLRKPGQRLLDLAALATPCCSSHQVDCCDPDDCGPCCEGCPTCPSLRRMKSSA